MKIKISTWSHGDNLSRTHIRRVAERLARFSHLPLTGTLYIVRQSDLGKIVVCHTGQFNPDCETVGQIAWVDTP